MDPEEALKRLRQLVKIHMGGDGLDAHEIDRMVTTFQGLDEWITKGGFLPADWQALKPA